MSMRKILRTSVAAAIVCVAAPGVGLAHEPRPFFPDQPSWRPAAAQVEQIESRVSLPAGADPLPTYDRFYTGIYSNGHEVIYGLYRGMTKLPRSGSVHIVAPEDIPLIVHGGCGVIAFEYDIQTKTYSDVKCQFG